MELIGTLVGIGIVAAIVYGSYRLFIAVLARAGALPWIGKVVTAETSKGVDKFRFSLGDFFNWNVTVNPEKGTVGGSMQVGTPKGWLVLGIVIALGAAFIIPSISGILLPGALVAVAVGFFRKIVRTPGERGRTPDGV